MKKRTNNDDWFDFFSNLMHLNIYKRGVLVPKYILYWKGYMSQNIKANKYPNLTIKER